MSRGTARSTMNIGRWRRFLSARSTAPRPMMGRLLAVQLMTASNSCSRSGRSAKRSTVAPKRAANCSPRSSVRLASARPRGFLAAKCVAHSAIIAPAPTNSTRIWLSSSHNLPPPPARPWWGWGGAKAIFHRPKNLGLAQHHRVQAAGDPKGMARGPAVLQRVGMRAQQRSAYTAAVRQPAQCVIDGGLVGGAIDLGAVAGGQHGRLHAGVAAQRLAQTLEPGRDLVEREREAAAQIERRGAVVDA